MEVWEADVAADFHRWDHLVREWPNAEVFAHPSYVKLYEDQASRAMCASLVSEAGTVLFPFLLRDVLLEPYADGLTSPAFDIITPYGYGGPFAWDCEEPEALAKQFWDEFDVWAENTGVVSEFLRLSLFEGSLLPYRGDVEQKQDNIVRSLELSEDDLWMDFDHKVRKNVKKAQRSGVEIEVDLTGERFEDFYRIYVETMDRRAASGGYYFTRDYFEAINLELRGHFAYFHAIHGGQVASTELALVSKDSVYSFLGGTDSLAFNLRPNDLLKFEIIRWAKQTGRTNFVLGGGYEPNDGIFRYKRAFAPNGNRPFSVGSRIHDADTYERLVKEKAETVKGWSSRPGFFPAYRS